MKYLKRLFRLKPPVIYGYVHRPLTVDIGKHGTRVMVGGLTIEGLYKSVQWLAAGWPFVSQEPIVKEEHD